jgi:threonylcarbamoyladenosine tRNA methylthiotransferase MtaB
MSVEVVSLGCRLNLAESETIRTLLAGESDLVVVNSCAVTTEAVRQTRQAIRKLRRAHPSARLLVTGCAAEVEREQIAAMPEVDGLIGNTSKLDPRSYNVAPNPVRAELVGSEAGAQPLPPFFSSATLQKEKRSFDKLRTNGSEVAHNRAFIAEQKGCDHACTFCVIPQGRGPSRSLTIAQVLREVERHLELGAPEMVLTGVDVTSWGHDLPGRPALGTLVGAMLDAFPELTRLRMSSLDGVEIDEQLFELFASEPRVMPHLHLSLQSGDDLTLKRMKRRHSRADAVELVARLKARRPEIAIGADIIAGFPTESAEMHAANRSIIRELEIVHGHIFPYSPRPGTPAARMPQVAPATIKARAAELRDEVARVRGAWLNSLIGKPLTVLAEADGTGHAENFARVALPEGTPRGAILTVTPTRLEGGLLQ